MYARSERRFSAVPDDFERLADINVSTSLFKYQNKKTVLYFFVSIPNSSFDEEEVRNSISDYYSQPKDPEFSWKVQKDPFMMQMKTKFEKSFGASLGFDGKTLINLKTATFKVQDRSIIFGYVWEWDDVTDKNERFNRADAIGDQAIGCNAIVNTLNSITNEYPGEPQYCFLTGFSKN